MATRRQLRTDLKATEQRATEAEQRARSLAAELVKVRDSLHFAMARADRMADRILSLERDAQQKAVATATDAENARLRRQLAEAHKALDNATNRGDAGLLTVRPHPGPRPDGEVTG